MKPIIVALDTSNFERSKTLIDTLINRTTWYKVGMEAFYSHGEQLLNYLNDVEADIFLDLKLHDIPNTVAKSLNALVSKYKIKIINIHALGGSQMLKNSATIIQNTDTKLIGVTILTSHDKNDLSNDLKIKMNIKNSVLHLNKLCIAAGLHGIVCSSLEAKWVKKVSPKDYIIVTPGVRLFAKANDQKRVSTPKEAFANGATHIVVGREITQSEDPLKALLLIQESLS